MNLGRLKQRAKILVPSIKTTSVDADALTALFNEGADEVNLLARVYKGYEDFNLVTDAFTYQISTITTKYLGIDEAGLWVQNTSGSWKQIIAKTKEYFNKYIPNWRDAESADMPQYYYIDGDDLVFYPPVNRSTAAAGRLYFLKSRTDMANDSHFPWTGTTTEITAYRPLDKALIEYVRQTLSPTLNKETGEDYSRRILAREVAIAMRQVKRRPDAMASWQTGLKFST